MTSFFILFFWFTFVITEVPNKKFGIHKPIGMLTRFRNLASYDITLWWITTHGVPNEPIRYFGYLPANGGQVSFTSYISNKFFFCKPGNENKERLFEFVIIPEKILYIYQDTKIRYDKNVYTNTMNEINFLNNYYNIYNKHWIAPYGRSKPTLPFTKFDIHKTSKNVFTSEPLNINSNEQSPNISFTIESINNNYPKIYRVKNFISKFEADEILRKSIPYMRRSMVGGNKEQRVDPTRTSTNAWLGMNSTKIVRTIYSRLADILGINKDKMKLNNPNELISSHLEVIHFTQNQWYSPHYDNSAEGSTLIFITAQIVLRVSEQMNGGATSFPNGVRIVDGKQIKGITIENKEFELLFWYNILNDGNLDETSMYGNNRVKFGEQFIAHVSIWDPKLPNNGDPRTEQENIIYFHDEL